MMIQFTLYTQAKVVEDPPPTFPRYAYKLTSFENIGNNVDNKTYLIGKTRFINFYVIVPYAKLFTLLNSYIASLATEQMF
jgi:hypothetical protein